MTTTELGAGCRVPGAPSFRSSKGWGITSERRVPLADKPPVAPGGLPHHRRYKTTGTLSFCPALVSTVLFPTSVPFLGWRSTSQVNTVTAWGEVLGQKITTCMRTRLPVVVWNLPESLGFGTPTQPSSTWMIWSREIVMHAFPNASIERHSPSNPPGQIIASQATSVKSPPPARHSVSTTRVQVPKRQQAPGCGQETSSQTCPSVKTPPMAEQKSASTSTQPPPDWQQADDTQGAGKPGPGPSSDSGRGKPAPAPAASQSPPAPEPQTSRATTSRVLFITSLQSKNHQIGHSSLPANRPLLNRVFTRSPTVLTFQMPHV